MKKEILKYPLLVMGISIFFWFYFQITTYPLKVDRWLQPVEARFILEGTTYCEPKYSWLGLLSQYALVHQGAYSLQVAFIEASAKTEHCESGFKDKLYGERVNEEHRYRYASTSKLLATAAIFNLVDDGVLSLDDKLVSFFPEIAQYEDNRVENITIAHLLDHSAGLNRLSVFGDPMFLQSERPWCPRHMEHLKTLRLSFSPGERQIYSNLGYCLLGAIIERVAGKSYPDFLEVDFSLGARNIKFVDGYYYSDEVRYDFRYDELYNNSYLSLFDFEAVSSAAGLSGSAVALAELLRDINSKKLHSWRFYKNSTFGQSVFAHEPYFAGCNVKAVDGCFGPGVRLYQPESNGLKLYFHDGYLPGSSSIAVIDSYGGVLVVVKSGRDRYQENPENGWVRWIYNRLNFYYALRGKVPSMSRYVRSI